MIGFSGPWLGATRGAVCKEHNRDSDSSGYQGVAAATILIGCIFVALAAGWVSIFERLIILIATRFPGLRSLSPGALDLEIRLLLKDPPRMWFATSLHLLSWITGVAETALILWVIGSMVGWKDAFVIEAIGTAARSLGFAIPAGLGAQEGGYVVACGLVGLSPQIGIALSALKRVRETIVILAGAFLWNRAESGRSRSALS